MSKRTLIVATLALSVGCAGTGETRKSITELTKEYNATQSYYHSIIERQFCWDESSGKPVIDIWKTRALAEEFTRAHVFYAKFNHLPGQRFYAVRELGFSEESFFIHDEATDEYKHVQLQKSISNRYTRFYDFSNTPTGVTKKPDMLLVCESADL